MKLYDVIRGSVWWHTWQDWCYRAVHRCPCCDRFRAKVTTLGELDVQSDAAKILSVLESSGLDLNRVISQCYDSARVIIIPALGVSKKSYSNGWIRYSCTCTASPISASCPCAWARTRSRSYATQKDHWMPTSTKAETSFWSTLNWQPYRASWRISRSYTFTYLIWWRRCSWTNDLHKRTEVSLHRSHASRDTWSPSAT